MKTASQVPSGVGTSTSVSVIDGSELDAEPATAASPAAHGQRDEIASRSSAWQLAIAILTFRFVRHFAVLSFCLERHCLIFIHTEAQSSGSPSWRVLRKSVHSRPSLHFVRLAHVAVRTCHKSSVEWIISPRCPFPFRLF